MKLTLSSNELLALYNALKRWQPVPCTDDEKYLNQVEKRIHDYLLTSLSTNNEVLKTANRYFEIQEEKIAELRNQNNRLAPPFLTDDNNEIPKEMMYPKKRPPSPSMPKINKKKHNR